MERESKQFEDLEFKPQHRPGRRSLSTVAYADCTLQTAANCGDCELQSVNKRPLSYQL